MIFIQYVLKKIDCQELQAQCYKYAETIEALCFYEKPTGNIFAKYLINYPKILTIDNEYAILVLLIYIYMVYSLAVSRIAAETASISTISVSAMQIFLIVNNLVLWLSDLN